ncbi:ComGF family competence protein [Alkalibacillus haloalkaliphilus]|uniref:ComGF family competence protein n=1 Tax=Alkalibacillus haloalkaliphilus TaxID=94136 RepID=UPI002936B279|nr:ComGF family competence protein [Alkalibacillus haloalkaliphilus]MDV2580979.1 ComGF family competence protein [Alkalibacillus haloalkaliphilus]
MKQIKSFVNISRTTCNEYGYTLLTTLVALTIFMLTLPMMNNLIKPIADLSPLNNINQLEVRQFDFLISFELNRSSEIRIANNRLHFVDSEGQIVTFEQHNDRVIRRTNQQGFVVMMFDTHEFKTEKIASNAFKVHFTRQGQQFETVFTHFNIKEY